VQAFEAGRQSDARARELQQMLEKEKMLAGINTLLQTLSDVEGTQISNFGN
jgi:hypothetical protein